ncbi:GspH/FimT family pseudopilin [Metapseudomonas boanensis]|uniref:Type II secretion system protein H n=1 Tax=Metapseudomonas boanensis TaxID=2822138 RepID=A0ABS5XNX2_9GAMM|nr:GspH/FimT family pseudopilin [Pseudomonas boanensis]MBT8768998.1 GspH/FimT family pseudopilin [Pseudomonas boanensis]
MQRAFTLIELMVAIALLAVLIGVAVPSYQSFIAAQRVRATVSDLHGDLVLARSEAVKRNRSMILTGHSSGWAAGWTLANPVAGQPDLISHSAVTGVEIEASAVQVQFSASGRVATAVTFEVSSAIGDEEAKISCLALGTDGRVTSSNEGC